MSDKVGLRGLNGEVQEGAKSLARKEERWRRDSVETGTTATSLGEQTLDKREGKDGTENREISDISWAKDLVMNPPELVDLEDIRRTATQQVRGLLGKLLRG